MTGSDIKALRERVEGQIWAAIRAGLESHEHLLCAAERASTYEAASAFRDEAARHIADGVIARPDVQALLTAMEGET